MIRNMSSAAAEAVEAGRAALLRGDGAAARELFEKASEYGETAEILDGMALSYYLDTDYATTAHYLERAYASYRREGDIAAAARSARLASWVHGNINGDWAIEQGWIARACSVLGEAAEDTAEHGWLLLLRAESESDSDMQRQALQRARALGRATGDTALEFEALGWLGLTTVLAGRFEEGLSTLDEALAAIFAGEVDDIYVIEGSFCGMLWGCEVAQDVPRAQQWIRAAEDVRRRRNLPAMAAFCRAHYGSILTAAGRWTEAETELTEAARMFERGETRMKVNALIRLADLRVRQGRLEEAEQLLAGLGGREDTQRALAALHLAKGEIALARSAADRALSGAIEDCGDASTLALVVEIALHEGKLGDAKRASARLDAVAGEVGGPFALAVAAMAQAQICVASGVDGARECIERSITGFLRAQTPLEVARARLDLARIAADDQPEVAIAEAKAALREFERLEAARHADAAGALLRQLGAPVRTGAKGVGALTKRESEVLQLLGHGLSNPEISDRLYISRKTVEHHVGNILSKLQLRSRAEAAAYAARAEQNPAQI